MQNLPCSEKHSVCIVCVKSGNCLPFRWIFNEVYVNISYGRHCVTYISTKKYVMSFLSGMGSLEIMCYNEFPVLHENNCSRATGIPNFVSSEEVFEKTKFRYSETYRQLHAVNQNYYEWYIMKNVPSR